MSIICRCYDCSNNVNSVCELEPFGVVINKDHHGTPACVTYDQRNLDGDKQYIIPANKSKAGDKIPM